VRTRTTTRSCSAVALIAVGFLALGKKPEPAPPSLFPVQPLWTLALNSQITVPPAFDGSIGYFAIDGDRIVAYDMLPGRERWIIDAKPAIELTASDGLLFVVEGGVLKARRSDDGAVAWQVPIRGEFAVPPVVDNGWLIVATTTPEIIALRASDGAEIWRKAVNRQAHARPALAADRVYIPTDDGHIVALRVEDGAVVWDRLLNAAANDILAFDERLYVGSNDNNLYCLIAKDGSIDWKWPTGGDVVGAPAADEHDVYFVSLDNVLRALDLKSGGQRWKVSLPIRPTRGLLRVGNVLVVTGLSAKVAAYNTADGKPAGDVPARGDLAAPPRIVEGGPAGTPIVIVVTSDIAKGALVTAFTKSHEPPIVPMAPLPNIIPVPVPKS
jgi:outer membrane protein assembly factor BamB